MKPESWKKLLITVSAIFISPLAQAHDSSQSIGLLAHIWAHGAEIAGIGLILGLLLVVAARYARRRTGTATVNHG